MKIVAAPPPMFDEICACFPLARTMPVLFAWGTRIFNPCGVRVRPELYAHEAAHGRRQGAEEPAIEAWWRRYLADPGFRFEEEIVGHRAELRLLSARVRDPVQRGRVIDHVAGKLSSPLYGLGVTREDARARLAA